MTVRSVLASPGHRVIVHFCTCGAWAAFGRGVSVRKAVATGNVALMGEWTCGPDGCRVAAQAGQLELLEVVG